MNPSIPPSKRLAIVQSNYIPWKKYFDLIGSVDEFILYDDAQFTHRDWRNRNRIKTARGPAWLTIPVVKTKRFLPVKDVEIQDQSWGPRHWKTILHSYSRAPSFKETRGLFEPLYLNSASRSLSEINFAFIKAICRFLKIQTKITWSMEYPAPVSGQSKTEKLISLCRQAGAARYVSGPSAKEYMEPALFEAAGIGLEYFDYSGYPEYRQSFPPFVHEVSILDLIFNEGDRSPRFMKNAGDAKP